MAKAIKFFLLQYNQHLGSTQYQLGFLCEYFLVKLKQLLLTNLRIITSTTLII